ncbi:hypothetical protein yc1106_09533 [Curvularia clavata]|uniref:DUF7587 domain-containing protein n=1 Tax=Curvularia clavata TaxID=95742 RepID=A0A9Q8ZGI0_CURCL|nr:hypothetical protein yc1106_09533 [Curvularia clavata]
MAGLSTLRAESEFCLYRVEDRTSWARYVEGEGIWAKMRQGDLSFWFLSHRFFRPAFKGHLYWRSGLASPFISAYASLAAAEREAMRRHKAGMQNVTIYKINVHAGPESLQYRYVPGLAEKLGVCIHERAKHNSTFEWVFLYHIPASAVTVYRRFDCGAAKRYGGRRGRWLE